MAGNSKEEEEEEVGDVAGSATDCTLELQLLSQSLSRLWSRCFCRFMFSPKRQLLVYQYC